MSAVTKALGLQPKMPAMPEPPPPPPTTNDARMLADTRNEMLRRRGRRSTVLTGAEGAAAPMTQRTTLIGS